MENIKKYKALLIIALIVTAGVFFFFYRFYRHDLKALADFLASYDRLDTAISSFSRQVSAPSFEDTPTADSWERKADAALNELDIKASARLSSLIKNDAGLMSLAREISDLSGKELEALKAYRRAVSEKNISSDRLAKEFADLTNKRQAAYARFKELGGPKD